MRALRKLFPARALSLAFALALGLSAMSLTACDGGDPGDAPPPPPTQPMN
jgi:hypothetical protein